MPMGIVVISCVRPSVQPSMGLGLCIAYKALGRNGLQFGMLMYPDGLHLGLFGFFCFFFPFFFLRLGLGQRRAVVIIGRWLLPSLVGTGDTCCHYWQHILVYLWTRTDLWALTSYWVFLVSAVAPPYNTVCCHTILQFDKDKVQNIDQTMYSLRTLRACPHRQNIGCILQIFCRNFTVLIKR